LVSNFNLKWQRYPRPVPNISPPGTPASPLLYPVMDESGVMSICWHIRTGLILVNHAIIRRCPSCVLLGGSDKKKQIVSAQVSIK